MTLIELRDKANTKLAALWPIIQSKQDAYFAKYGQYFGLRWSPNSNVVDGADTSFEPNYPSRAIQKLDVTFNATTVPFRLQIERINQSQPNIVSPIGQPVVYGPTQETYRAWVSIELPNGDTYMRHRTRDNEDSGWFQADETAKPPVYQPEPEPTPWTPPENPFPPIIQN